MPGFCEGGRGLPPTSCFVPVSRGPAAWFPLRCTQRKSVCPQEDGRPRADIRRDWRRMPRAESPMQQVTTSPTPPTETATAGTRAPREVTGVGGKSYEIRTITGTVLEAQKGRETHVTASGGGGVVVEGTGHVNPTIVSSVTTVHDGFFLRDARGREHSFQLVDFDLSLRAGHEATVVSLGKKGKPGRYVLVRNHTTRRTYFHEPALESVFQAPRWVWWVLAAPAALLYVALQQMGAGMLALAPPVVAVGVAGALRMQGSSRLAAFKRIDFDRYRG